MRLPTDTCGCRIHNAFGENGNVHREHKYARVEWERRFLLEHFPPDATVTQVRRIIDRYVEGTSLRLRRQFDAEGNTVLKLSQKLRSEASGARQGLITTMYLKEDEFALLSTLPARILTKTRHSIPPFGVDVFEGELQGLIMAEAEFNSAAEASELKLQPFIACEVSDDVRFAGGSLVRRETRSETGLRSMASARNRIHDGPAR